MQDGAASTPLESNSIDSDLARLAQIAGLLETTTAFNERLDLANERDAIRARWKAPPLGSLSNERLAGYLASLHTQIEGVLRRHIPMANMGARGGDGSGIDPLFIMENNRKVDEEAGLDELIALREAAKVEQLKRNIHRPDDVSGVGPSRDETV